MATVTATAGAAAGKQLLPPVVSQAASESPAAASVGAESACVNSAAGVGADDEGGPSHGRESSPRWPAGKA